MAPYLTRVSKPDFKEEIPGTNFFPHTSFDILGFSISKVVLHIWAIFGATAFFPDQSFALEKRQTSAPTKHRSFESGNR